MPMSILEKIMKMSIWYLNLNIDPFITLVKVKVIDTYGVVVSSPKQYDPDRSIVKVTETAHWILKVRPYLRNKFITFLNVFCVDAYIISILFQVRQIILIFDIT